MLNKLNVEGQELECNLEIGKQLYDEGKKKDAIGYFLEARKIDDDPRVTCQQYVLQRR